MSSPTKNSPLMNAPQMYSTKSRHDDVVELLDIAFLEFSSADPKQDKQLFEHMGFTGKSSHTHADLTLFYQSKIRFVCNQSQRDQTRKFIDHHHSGVSAIGFMVEDADVALQKALAKGAQPVLHNVFKLPAIQGIGATQLYFLDNTTAPHFFAQFGLLPATNRSALDINRIDHLTFNLFPGGIHRVANFFEALFGFKRLASFNIDGKKTGLVSEVIANQSGTIVMPLNESKDDKSQIAEFLKDHHGEGIQHIALSSDDIYHTIDSLKKNGIAFQETPAAYYDNIDARIPGHGQDIAALAHRHILIDGKNTPSEGLLLQIFTHNAIGPLFFEFIQRMGNKGFGEGNFQALFESIELDQERRGMFV